MCDDEISRYYRHLYTKEYPYLNSGYSQKLTRPVWGAHISCIRGEYIPNMKLWGLDSNKIVEFDYDAGVLDNKEYYWLRVNCPVLSELRRKYGLSAEPRFGFHLTIGRTTNT
jgi:hypothetical protein